MRCTKCRRKRLRRDFFNSQRRQGRGAWCKKCCQRYAESPAGKLARRRYNLKRTANITVEEWEALYKKQRGRCANPGCRRKNGTVGRGRLHVDHDHKTGRVRGLICSHCNTALGCVQDSCKILKGLIRYLHQPQTRRR